MNRMLLMLSKPSMNQALLPLLACTSLSLCLSPAHANDYPGVPDDQEICEWEAARPPGPSVYTIDVGTWYVPRDAPVGTPINPPDMRTDTYNVPRAALSCFRYEGPHTLHLYQPATAPVFPGPLPPLNGEDLTGKVLETGIPGVGIRIKLGHPFDGVWANAWKPVGPPIIPFDAIIDHFTELYVRASALRAWVTLIKTGPIPPGAHSVNGYELYTGSASNVGHVWRVGMQATVIQAQCNLPQNPVSADPVELGTWDKTDFTGPGFTTPAVPFQITLSDCEDDPDGGVATAHIRLEGTKGSTPIDAQRGIFGLTDDSTAEGVGIQMLMADGVTPVQLNQDVPLQAISPSGDTVLPFSARFYQTEASQAVKPGSAKGALNFTITYQ